MFFEHIIYSAALAVIVGMIYFRVTRRDPSWIIIAVAFAPDIDFALGILRRFSRNLMHFGIRHGDFHNILVLIIFSILVAVILRLVGIRFIDGFICAAIGFAAHLFEDAMVYKMGYAFFWPISSKIYGIGIMPETYNFFGIANSTVLVVGIILLALVVLVRTLVDGKGWRRVFLQGGLGSDFPEMSQ